MVTNLIDSGLTRLPGGRRILLGLARMSERALPDELLTNEQRLMVAIDALTTRWAVPETADRPVFLLSAGWRSGSTLLQRLVLSSRQAFIWGEPYGRSAIVPSLASSLIAFSEGWPREDQIVSSDEPSTAEDQWVANRYPPTQELVQAHRAFLHRLFAEPAQNHGCQTWGFKEVRLGGAHARYLKLLYPECRLVFLHRDPYAAWRSFRAKTRSPWYWRWPDVPVIGPRRFGQLWRHLTHSLLSRAQELSALSLSYEDLTREPRAFDRLQEHLEFKLDESILDRRLGSSSGHSTPVPGWERRLLEASVEPLASQLGYAPVR